jgi:gas vesicle protein
MNDNTKVIAALLAGLAAGAALGILFAPDRGSETRDKLNDALKNLGDAIKDRAAEEIEKLSSFKEDVVDKIKTGFNKDQGFDPSMQDQTTASEQL